jgi:GDPmannose 4,6-dehydratase
MSFTNTKGARGASALAPLADVLAHNKKIDIVNILNIDSAIKHLDKTKKCVFISGVTGQDGSHMVDYLLEKTDYIIFGGVRRLSVYNHINLKNVKANNRFFIINFDLTDPHVISKLMEKLQPDYFINFAAQSFVASSWDFARQTWQTNSTAVLDILEAILLFKPSCRLYQAGSSEEFGNVSYIPQDEKHPMKPRSPYGASKVASRQIIKVYRDSYNLYAIQGWLFNHEGTRRGEEFVTRKISKNVVRIAKEMQKHNNNNNNDNNNDNNKYDFKPLELGNIYAKRDWSDAEDFIEGVWKMLHQDTINKNYNGVPDEYVFSSNETHTIKEFVELAFESVNIFGYWSNKTEKPEDEKFYYKKKNGSDESGDYEETDIVLVEINPSFYRPAEVEILCGDSTRARTELNWVPKVSFKELVKKMVNNDLHIYEN